MSRTIYLSTPSSAGEHALESLFKEAKKKSAKTALSPFQSVSKLWPFTLPIQI
ncbi:hypothetical protein GZC29_002615 [Salmonella enterica]|nr:hypothetical protein [Salmonella enterica]EEH2866849.1 hypothetical protein [Salmonella enterica]